SLTSRAIYRKNLSGRHTRGAGLRPCLFNATLRVYKALRSAPGEQKPGRSGSIILPQQALANIMQPDLTTVEMVTQLPTLPPRPRDSNKGMVGRVLVVAGSRGMSGAAVLCASAALRGGAGLVYLAVPHEIQPQVAGANPCYLTAALPQDDDGRLSAPAEVA